MEDKIYPVPSEWTRRAFVDEAKYKSMYNLLAIATIHTELFHIQCTGLRAVIEMMLLNLRCSGIRASKARLRLSRLLKRKPE